MSSLLLPCLPFGVNPSPNESNEYNFPSAIQNLLFNLSKGPNVSTVWDGTKFAKSVLYMWKELHISETDGKELLEGMALFFDQVLDKSESSRFFKKSLPILASLAIRFPELLKKNIEDVRNIKTINNDQVSCFENSLLLPPQVISSQQPGIILMTQELACAFLTGALFCSYSNNLRQRYDLPYVNFTGLFYGVRAHSQIQIEKLKCLIHYFNTVCDEMPTGTLSFERKVLNHSEDEYFLSQNTVMSFDILSSENIWKNSALPLCPFIISPSGTIEDDGSEDLEVDFANKYLGGGTLKFGCVQEEIRFVISPELIVGMIFFPSMADNETIQIIGSQRFCKYAGYGKSFRFNGDYKDETAIDSLKRRKTFLIAMDALCLPGIEQFKSKYALRELQKALCGFLQHPISNEKREEEKDKSEQKDKMEQKDKTGAGNAESANSKFEFQKFENLEELKAYKKSNCDESFLGVSTGNWGCGAFGGDLQFKSFLQWMAASQAQRNFISYFTFGDARASSMQQVVSQLTSKNLTVKDLYNIILKYASFLGDSEPIPFFDYVLCSL